MRKSFIFFLVLSLFSGLVNGQNFSEVGSTGLPAIGNSQIEWADFNNDGFKDVLILGTDNSGDIVFELYSNNGDDTFSASGLPIGALKNSSFIIDDFNDDNQLDIFYTGKDDSENIKNYLLINDGSGFTVLNDVIGQYYRARILALDVNLDGQVDLVINGYNESNSIKQSVWIQDDLTFTKSADYSLPDIALGSLVAADFNNDGIIDFLTSGENSNAQFETHIYLINTNGSLTEKIFSPISDLLINEIKALDFTGDGLTDLMFYGLDGAFNSIQKWYQQNGSSYNEINNVIDVESSASIDMLDIDNDGDQDFAVSGLNSSGNYTTQIYGNDGAGNFTLNAETLTGVANGSIHIVDFNNDSKNDLYVSGYSDVDPDNAIINYLSENSVASTNSSPSIPINPTSLISGKEVEFSWDPSTDDLSASAEIKYAITLGSSTGNYDLMSPLSLNNGVNPLMTEVFLSTQNQFYLQNLDEGEYFWKVRAIDAGSKSSAFSSEESFIICDSPDLGVDQQICYDDVINLSAGTPSDIIKWYSKNDGLLQNGGNDFSISLQTNDTIIVKVEKKPLGCIVYDTVNVEVIPLPVSSLPADTSACYGSNILLEVSIDFDEVNWYRKDEGLIESNSKFIEIELFDNDTIIAELINDEGCIGKDTVLLFTDDLPNKIATRNFSLCFGDTLSYTLPNNYDSIRWESDQLGLITSNTNEINYLFNENDTLLITKVNDKGCSVTDTVAVTINPLPTIGLLSEKRVCEGEITEISIDGTWDSIEWRSANNGLIDVNVNSIEFLVTADDSIFVSVEDSFGCVNSDTLLLIKKDLPLFDLGNDTTLCTFESILLETSSGFSKVEWESVKLGIIEEEDWFLNYEVLQTDTLIATAFAFNGCTYTDSIIVNAINLPQFSLGNDQSICIGDSVNISLDGSPDSVNWYMDGALLDKHNNTIQLLPKSSTTIVSEFFNSNKCVNTDTLLVTIKTLPNLNLADTINVCEGEMTTISIDENFQSIQWYSENEGLIASDQIEISMEIKQSDLIWVEVEDTNTCFNSDSIRVIKNDLPEFSLGPDQQICEGNIVQLEIDNPADSINWFNNLGEQLLDTSAILNFEVNQNQTWWAEQWNASSCVFSDTVQITNIPLPDFDAGDSILICEEAEVQLNTEGINDNWTFAWSPAAFLSDASIANPIANPEEDTWFFLEVQNAEGCVYTDSVFVGLDQPLILDAGEDRTICLDDFTELGGAPTADGSNFTYQYEWSPAESLDDPNVANPIANPSETTTFQLIAWAGNCKADTAEVTVSVQFPPEITLTADTTIGAGDAIQVLASGGSFYQWKPERGLSDATIANPIASPSRTTSYTVEVLDSLGCISEKEMTIFVENQLFIPNLFTPNNDGQNDFFKVYGAGIKQIEFKVFTRGGKLLYSTNSVEEAYGEGWDGKYNGNPVESGVYVWSIKGEYFDERPLSFNGQQSGVINLMR
ncbi:FG-GAP-like repeat-containing protein [Marivirga salinae]|uniref:FG-GAP-like repeat-containing protein n=1 Tax=Marivirga salinarum TaxID=3059078 RepID=A0AA51NC71_9BACT|nr:FG-GAP-like repeat-containing protein [Marivirga sp. BDSF4-3]WMN12697.1 FG-GAP-like repeat-containing protein [Marivirga sp. BDSF4-3]